MLESLESRCLMSTSTSPALQVNGFEPVDWNGQQTYAKAGQWILSVDNVHGRADQQLNAINKLLGNVRKDAKATKLLGKDGLAVIEAPKALKHADLNASLARLPGFRFVEPDLLVTAQGVLNDTYFSTEWGLHNTGQSAGTVDADIDAPEAWDITRGDGSVIVGVIDSGVDYTHPDLAGAIFSNVKEVAGDGIDNDANGYIDDTRGWDFANNDNNPMDDNGHGTHVAGTIAATGNNGTGVAGVANAKVLPLKFLAADGSGSISAAIAAINYATKLKQSGVNIQLTNNSWGAGGSSVALYDAIKANGDAGMLFIAAAGNGGADQVGDNNDTTANYPSNYALANIVAVAATDRNDARGSFSNYGATTVDLAAPGVAIASTYPGNQYVYMDGTSMASPHVAGAAALAFSYAPGATAAQVKAALLNGVDPVSSMSGKSVTGGRLNARRTLELLAPPTSAPAAPTALTASGGSNAVTLAWTDNASDESGFRVERSTDGGATFTEIATAGANITGYTNSGLAASTTYVYRVRAYNTVGNSAYTNAAGATTAAATVTTPAAPSALTAAAASASQIRLTWTDNSGNEGGFKIERSTNGTSWTQVGTVGANATSYLDGGLRKRTTYSYRICAYNTAGNSAYTNTASARTLSSGGAVAASSGTRSVFSSIQIDSALYEEIAPVAQLI